MASVKDPDPDSPEFVEVDPTGRYGRYNDILGKGASKIVYRAFDEYEGIEVAWNQVKLYDFLQSPEDLERLYCEIHLLKTLKHKNIMKFYTSWVDTSKRNINFITEMFTSGTLRQYRQKHRRVNIRAVKHWCRQILNGLLYLHSHDPPIIHRDLKCDNIFVNGNQGQVKIGDLGLAAILRKSHAVHCVGTLEFMAPEVYEEEYNELVDIYSFGMCLLEMVTFEYPYSECSHPAQIYKKVISGTKPDALFRVEDPEVREFIEKCLVTASRRLSARELLIDPFLQTDDRGLSFCEEDDLNSMGHLLQPYLIQAQSNGSLITNAFTDNQCEGMEFENCWGCDSTEIEAIGMDLSDRHDPEHPASMGISIKGRRTDDGNIFLWLRIADRDGRVRNINFIFDVEADTALSVATEMVAELDITEYEVTRIADIIDGEVALLVPAWKRGHGIEELPGVQTTVCKNCASNVSSCGSLLDYLSLKNPAHTDLRCHCCPHLECTEIHGRFEEITYQVEESELCVTEGEPMSSTCQSELDFSSQASRGNHSDEHEQLDHSDEDEKTTKKKGHMRSCSTISLSQLFCRSEQQKIYELSGLKSHFRAGNDSENDIERELRLLKPKCQMELHEYRRQQLQGSKRFMHDAPSFGEEIGLHNGISRSLLKALQPFNGLMESFHLGRHNSFSIPEGDADATTSNKGSVDTDPTHCCSSQPDRQVQRGQNCEANAVGSCEMMCKMQNFYARSVLPNSLPRTKSLPVDVGNI